MDGNVLWYVLLSVSGLILLLAASLSVVALVIYLKSCRIMKNNADLYELATPSALRELLKLSGAYFFSVENGNIKISNSHSGDSSVIESRLSARKDVREFIESRFRELNSTVTPKPSSLQIRIALTGNEKHWYEMRLDLTRFKGDQIRSRGILIPIDNIKQQEKEALEMHRRTLNAEERDDFIREMNHAVRTPLNAIVGFSELLSDPTVDISAAELSYYKETIEQNAGSLTKVLENVLTISHLENENILVEDRQLDVPSLMRSVISENAQALVASGIIPKEEPSPSECVINADERIVRKVLQILVDNVIQHASSGKCIIYGWREVRDGDVELFVRDKGPGISETDLPFIYKAFYKADPFSSGTGQGLTIAKSYLDHEKAEIRCESSNDGASFYVGFRKVLPLFIPLPIAGFGLLVLSVLLLLLSLKFLRSVRKYRDFSAVEDEAITRTLEVSGGHLFKYKDDVILMTRQTAEYFSFSSNRIGLDVYLDSMDEADKNVIGKIKAAPVGEIVNEFLSLPNFRTFKIMSFSCIATKMEDNDGQMVPMGLFFSIDESHSRLEAMREVYAKEEESISKQSFIASMGHEIRNPLNAIVGFSNLLADLYFDIDEKERESYADIIRKSNEHLLSLLDGALLSAKEQDKLLKSSLGVIPVDGFMEELFKTNSVVVPSYLSFDYDKGDSAYINVSRTGMRQIVSNLINNACKFTAQGGITFGWNTTVDRVNIFVRDTGMGIGPENIDNIFKKFFKADSSSSGAGIGLPLCKRLTEMMDGNLIVESELGRGSCFTISLPRIYPESDNKEQTK